MVLTWIQFPPELVQQIIEQLKDDRLSLSAVVLTSRTSLLHSQPVLYRSFTSHDKVTHTKFLTSIVKNPQLAHHVRTFYSDGIASYNDDPVWPLMLKAFPLMINLKELVLRLVRGHPAADLLTACSFQLDTLTWNSHSDEVGLPIFLTRQHSLRTLSWTCDNLPKVPASACPHLRSLTGGHYVMYSVLPGRNVSHIDWVTGQDDPVAFGPDYPQCPPSDLALPLSKIYSMEIGSYWGSLPMFYLTPYLSSLRFLEIHSFNSDDLEAISQFPMLQHCLIHPLLSYQILTPPSRNTQITQAQFLFGHSKSLVLFEQGHRPQVYRRWVKGVIQDEQVSIHEVRAHKDKCVVPLRNTSLAVPESGGGCALCMG